MNTFEQSKTSPDILIASGLGVNPIELYLSSDPETRSNILLNHPQVLGFVFLNDDVITKAFLPKRVIDWRTGTKSIAAVSGTPEDFVPFSLREDRLCGDDLFLCEKDKLHHEVKKISASKFFKDNRRNLDFVPECASTDAKAKNLVIVSFPAVLPLIHDFTFEEGPLSDEVITNAFEKVHDLYDDYLHLKTKAEPLETILFSGDLPYPKPEGVGDIKEHDLPMKVLLAQRNSSNNAHGIIKQKVEYFKTQFGLNETNIRTIPQEVNALPDNSTIVTGGTSSADTKVIKRKRNTHLFSFNMIATDQSLP